jgi:hypothetical protein
MFDESDNDDGFHSKEFVRSILQKKIFENVDRLDVYDSIFNGCKILVEDGLDSYICSNINFEVLDGYFVDIEISVNKDDVLILLEKVMNFYIEQELYEKCAEVKKFKENLPQ